MATSGLMYDNRSSSSGFALGNGGTVITDNSSVLWINYYITHWFLNYFCRNS